MAKLARLPDLDVAEDPDFHRRFQRVQRFSWAVMALIVAAALAGVFGYGPVSRATIAAGPVEVEYERVVRALAQARVVVRRSPGEGGASTVAVALESRYLENMGLQRVGPDAERVEAGHGITTFVFATRDGTLAAVFDFKPRAPGRTASSLHVDGRAVGDLRHLVLP